MMNDWIRKQAEQSGVELELVKTAATEEIRRMTYKGRLSNEDIERLFDIVGVLKYVYNYHQSCLVDAARYGLDEEARKFESEIESKEAGTYGEEEGETSSAV